MLSRLILAVGGTLLLASALPAAQARRPDVVVIVVDDLNDWIGPLGGHPQVRTPNIDRLAARGVTFSNAHCQSPLCNPSRTSFLTGLRPSTTGVYALDPWFRSHPPLKDLVTFPQHFQANGYITMATGKIFHDGMPGREARRDGVEFSRWGYAGSHGPFPEKKLVQTESPSRLLDWGVFPQRDEQLQDHKVANWAIEQLKLPPGEKPLLLCVGFRRPHVPCLAPQEWFDLYPDDETLVMPQVKPRDRDDVPAAAEYLHWRIPEPRLAWLEEHNQWRNLVRSYLACVSFMDGQVGRVLDALDASGRADETIIVLWSDHGFHLGEKGITGKLSLWERSTRVPLIVAGPGVADDVRGAKVTRPAELIDIYPTLVELCGLPPRQELEGRSLRAQLKDPSAPRTFPAITTHGQDNHAVRSERFRYIRYYDGSEELYDHAHDPHEWTNLAGDVSHADTKRQLARFLPALNHPPIPGSETRLHEMRDGRRYWEGKAVEIDEDVARQAEPQELKSR